MAEGTSHDNPFGYPEEDIEDGKLMATLCWMWPVCLVGPVCAIIALNQKNNAFALFHAKQSLGVGLLSVLYVGIVSAILLALPYFVAMLLGIIFAAAYLGAIVLGLIPVTQGKYSPFPFIGDWIENLFKGIQKEA